MLFPFSFSPVDWQFGDQPDQRIAERLAGPGRVHAQDQPDLIGDSSDRSTVGFGHVGISGNRLTCRTGSTVLGWVGETADAAERMNMGDNTKQKATKNHHSLLTAIDVGAWISFLALIGASIWVFSGPAHFPKGGPIPLSLLIGFAVGLPGTFGIIWTIIRSGKRYDDEKKRLQGREPTLTRWLLAWMPFFIIVIWMAIEVVLVRTNPGGY